MRRVFEFVRIGVLCGVALASDCNCPPLEPVVPVVAPSSQSATGIEVLPHHVTIALPANASTTIELEARLRTAAGLIIAESYGFLPVWTVTGGGSSIVYSGKAGHRATIQISTGGGPLAAVQAVAKAETSGVSSDPSSVIELNPATMSPDVVTSAHSAGDAPEVALFDGKLRGSESCSAGAVAFVGAGPLGDLVAPCETESHTAVFSARRAMHLVTSEWSASPERIDAPDVGPLLVPVAIWIAIDDEPEDATTLAQIQAAFVPKAVLDVEHTNALLQANRVGIRLSIVTGFPQTWTPTSSVEYLCTPPVSPQPGVLNVYYVSRLVGGVNGHTCLKDETRAQTSIFLASGYNTGTLPHELGHALGLLFPDVGHTTAIAGFREINLMQDGMSDGFADRSHWSLGQVFRMNADERSWINQSVGTAPPIRQASLTLDCGCDPYARGMCPRLVEDVVPIATDEVIKPWRCADQVWIAEVPTGNAIALMSGRLWKSGICVKDLAGTRLLAGDYHDWTMYRFYFPNFTHPDAGCPARLSVYFENGGVFFHDVDPDSLSLLLDQYNIRSVPHQIYHIPVHIWFGDLPGAARDRDVATTEKIFSGQPAEGVSNRTGLSIDWPSVPTTTARPTKAQIVACNLPSGMTVANGINVYYIDVDSYTGADRDQLQLLMAPEGGWSCGTETYSIFLPLGTVHSSTSLAHHVGKALSLTDWVVDEALWDPRSNVMWYEADESRVRFTLGQVFRMTFDSNSWLNASPSSPRYGSPIKYVCDAVAICPTVYGSAPE